MDMNEILETLKETKSVAPPTDQRAFDPEAPHVFNESKDKIGLPLEHAKYAKRTCNKCYGRGSEIVRRAITKSGVIYGTLFKRERRTCSCVHKGYVKTRKQYERDVEKLCTEQGLSVDKAREYVYGYIFGDV